MQPQHTSVAEEAVARGARSDDPRHDGARVQPDLRRETSGRRLNGQVALQRSYETYQPRRGPSAARPAARRVAEIFSLKGGKAWRAARYARHTSARRTSLWKARPRPPDNGLLQLFMSE